jgi:hypothetical protein
LEPNARVRWARAIRSRAFLDATTPLAARFVDAGIRAGIGADGYARLFESSANDAPLPSDLRRKDSVYWTLSTKCNNGYADVDDSGDVTFRTCAHCLNGSGPHGVSMTFEEVERVVGNLPEALREVELSGGEALHPDVLPLTLHALRLCSERFGSGVLLSVQTNGDFLRSARKARELLAALRKSGLRRLVIASMDLYHGRARNADERFEERKRHYARIADNLRGANVLFVGSEDYGRIPSNSNLVTVHFFGADVQNRFDGFIVDDLAPNVRAVRAGLVASRDAGVRYCAFHAGARGFLGSSDDDQIAINGGPVTPCCWFTEYPLGDARSEPIPEMLHAYVTDPLALAQHLGQPDRVAEIAAFVSPALGASIGELVAANREWNECVACRRVTTDYARLMRDAGYPLYETLWRDIPVPWNHRVDPEYEIAFRSWVNRKRT